MATYDEIKEVAYGCIELWNQARYSDAYRKYYAEDAVKVEPTALGEYGNEIHGLSAIIAHEEMIQDDIAIVNSLSVSEGPFIGATGFSVIIKSDFTINATSTRHIFREVGVFTVKGGKIVREEYLYDEAEYEQALKQS